MTDDGQKKRTKTTTPQETTKQSGENENIHQITSISSRLSARGGGGQASERHTTRQKILAYCARRYTATRKAGQG